MSTKTFETLKTIKLLESTKVLCGPNNKPLHVLGQVVVQLTYEGRSYVQTACMCHRGPENNLLGLPAITAIQFLTKVDSIQTNNVYQSFPKSGDLQRRLPDPVVTRCLA